MEYDDMIEAFAPDTVDQAFDEWILPGRSSSCNDLLDTHVLYAIAEVRAVDRISIAYQKARRSLFWKRFDDLLRRPLSCRMFSHVEMNNHPAVMSQDNECKQYPESGCRNRKEVDCHDVLQVIVEESSPCW